MLQRIAGPPRHVPLSLRIVSIFNPVVQFGLLFAGFGSIFFWIFATNADLSFITFHGALSRATGYVTSVQKTNAKENRVRVHANHYTYSVAGRSFSGISYSSGQEVDPGAAVTVEYKADDPSRSRILGMRRNLFGPAVLLVVLFPLIGLLIAGGAIAFGIAQTRRLRTGEIVVGTAISREKTPLRKSRSTSVTYEYTPRDGVKRRRTVSVYDEQLAAENERLLLYDPAYPEQADVLPATPRSSVDGPAELGGRPLAALGALIIPIIVIGANVVAARMMLR